MWAMGEVENSLANSSAATDFPTLKNGMMRAEIVRVNRKDRSMNPYPARKI